MYDRFRLAAKLLFRSRVTFEEEATSAPRAMAQKTLRDYSAPSASQVPTGPEVNTGGENFEIKMGLITMVQASPFCGRANEDASAHLGLQYFCYQGCIARCNPAPSVPVLSFGESEAIVLC